jgi:hypothetical protein
MEDEGAVREAFARQAGWCRNLGSPLTALIEQLAAERLDRSTKLGRRILDWPAQPGAAVDMLPLRLSGGLHALARRGHPALAPLYPPHPLPDAGTLWTAMQAALLDPALAPWLDSVPQTNEVARSAILMAGLLVVAAETGLPMALHELGASAGLNLLLDQYDIRLAGVQAGTPGSALALEPDWTGPPPPAAPVRVVRRSGVDLLPLNVMQEADRERLRAYVWADQEPRLARLEAALAIALAQPPRIVQGDAAAWTEAAISLAPEPGVVRVLMHSVAFTYFPAETQARIAGHMAAAGRQATPAAPLAWLRFEPPPGHAEAPTLRLQLWPGGEDRVLGAGSPHGAWIRWTGQTAS